MRIWQVFRAILLLALGLGLIEAYRASRAPEIAVLAPKRRPNVVVLSIDTLRRDHLTFYGYTKRATSPKLRELSESGITFDNAIAVHTNTAPAHASMFTGAYPNRHGLHLNGMKLGHDWLTLAERLKRHGYATGGFVSGWTLGKRTQLDQGFDVYDHHGISRDAAGTWAKTRQWLEPRLESQEPFFLFLHFFDPHFPYKPPRYMIKRIAKGVRRTRPAKHKVPGLAARSLVAEHEKEPYEARYDAEIAQTDEKAGQLVALLKKRGVYENTIVLFTSDHGETLWERAWVLDHGGRVYDEQVRIPLVIRLPKDAHAGRRIKAQASQVDYMATILDCLGLPIPDGLDGQSLLGWVQRGEPADTRAVFSYARTEPVRVPEVRGPLKKDSLLTSIRKPPYKLIEYPKVGGGFQTQLFDLGQDPGERHDLAAKRPDVVGSLHQQLSRFRGDRSDQPVTWEAPQFSDEVKKNLKALGYME